MTGNDCAVCKIIRTYLLFAVPLLALVGAGAMDGSENAALWFARVEMIDILAWGSVAALFLILSYRGYEEYYLPNQRRRALDDVNQRLDSILDTTEENISLGDPDSAKQNE
jgi:hypothetical protein|tara:strand:+ start:257 stop:589 length:333 start_codon:yes stop_codon:yes gene_type:complete